MCKYRIPCFSFVVKFKLKYFRLQRGHTWMASLKLGISDIMTAMDLYSLWIVQRKFSNITMIT